MKSKLILAASLTLFMGISAAFGFAWLTKRKADRLIGNLEIMTTENWRATLRRMQGDFSDFRVSPDCTPDDCKYEFELVNTLLSRLRLAPRTELATGVLVKGGQLHAIILTASGAGSKPFAVWIEKDFCDSCSPEGAQIKVKSRTDAAGRTVQTVIDLTSAAAPLHHAAAFDVNTSCLISIGGCSSTAEALPSLARIQ